MKPRPKHRFTETARRWLGREGREDWLDRLFGVLEEIVGFGLDGLVLGT